MNYMPFNSVDHDRRYKAEDWAWYFSTFISNGVFPAPSDGLQVVAGDGMTIGVLAEMKAVVSMRLHGLVFAAGQGVPLAGVSYDPKVTAFLDYIEQDNYQELENLTVENASSLVDSAIQLGREGGELRRRTELLNEKENINREAALRLLERSASI